MPRRNRLDYPGIPQHLVHRGNNRGVTFFHDDDREHYLALLGRHAGEFGVDIHAWVLMTNHVHLLATAHRHGALSTLMQDVGREYVRAINATYRRSGTLWEGRFHSCLVQSDTYVLTCMRYIELNPVRARMVADPAQYRWSSYRSNAQGSPSALLRPHPVYLSLEADVREKGSHPFIAKVLQPDAVCCAIGERFSG